MAKYAGEDAVKKIVSKLKNKQDKLSAGDGVNINNNVISVNNSNNIIEISSQYIRITDLATGIYKLTYNGQKYIYYDGSTSTSAHSVVASTGAILLFVNRYSNTRWYWYYINGSSSNTVMYYGYTTTSSGFSFNKTIDKLVMTNGHTTSANKFLMSSSSSGLGNWVSADSEPTENSKNPINSGGVYNAIQNSKIQLLWENPSPASAFPAQTITLATNDCDYFIVEFIVDTNFNSTICDSVTFKVGEGAIASLIAGEQGLQAGNMYINNRVITASTQTTITFSNSWRVGGSSDTGHTIPKRVLGFKIAT